MHGHMRAKGVEHRDPRDPLSCYPQTPPLHTVHRVCVHSRALLVVILVLRLIRTFHISHGTSNLGYIYIPTILSVLAPAAPSTISFYQS